ncbi:protein 5NUC-like isoform X2 [Prorops nasuta]|uniref:protein 5NUC-like isoform X2 n=1 Tax=Prorops nasuta TaxID=863751 RepID=UPI0034CD86A6
MKRSLKIACTLMVTLAMGSVITGAPPKPRDEDFTIRIVHTNDMHSRFDETSRLSTACSPQDSENKKCYGGFARIATLVRQARKSTTPSLFLNAGDTYQGTIWYNIYKWQVVARLLNILAPSAISLGNHEFDDGVKGLVPFINNASFPVLTCNLDLSKEPTLANTKLANSTVLMVKGKKIGVIGYLTPETKIVSMAGEVNFKDEVECIREEAKRLKASGVEILIALGHSGFETDQRIAREVEDIDLVIGGHTNTFLYTGKQPDVEVPEGLYPFEVTQPSGRKTYVVQAYAYTKYLGNFEVGFDDKGEVTRIQGNPILVDGSVEQAKDVLEVLDEMRSKLKNDTETIVGKTHVLIDGDSKSCRRQECNMGNLITDAIIDYNANQYVIKDGWTDAPIALQNSGSIRASITRNNKDMITKADVLGTLPFGNIVYKVKMTGKQLLEVLEWGVRSLDLASTANLNGAFLQVSGLQVVYDTTKPTNSRVVSVQVQCANCTIPSYSPLNITKIYTVLLNDFMHNGGDGYQMLKNLNGTSLAIETAEVLVEYLKKYSPVHPGVEWRIRYDQLVSQNESSNENHEIILSQGF